LYRDSIAAFLAYRLTFEGVMNVIFFLFSFVIIKVDPCDSEM
jgi:hypothetical protein